MKTYTIEIDGKTYTMRMQGTVGIQIVAQSIVTDDAERWTTDESGEKTPTAKWLMALLYAVFYTSNEEEAEKVDFVKFMMSFSSKEFQEAIRWYYEAYAEREGLLPDTEDESNKEQSDDAKKS